MKTDDALELAQTLFEEMGDAAFVVDPQTLRVLDANPMARRLTALPRDELLGTSLPDLIRADLDDALAHLRRALHTTQTFHSQEGYHLRRGGSGGGWTPVNLSLTRLHTERKPLGLVLARDVTEQHRVQEQLRQANAELERRVRERTAELGQMNLNLRATVEQYRRAADDLRASEERFRLLVDGVPDHAIIMLDPDGTVRSWNTGAEGIHGFPAGEIVGRPFATLFPPEEAATEKPADELRRAAAEGTVKEEGWRVRKGGGRFWANGTLTALYHPDGRVRGFAKITRDLTERLRAEEQLRRSEEQFRAFMDHSPAAAWITDADGRMVYLSDSYRRVLLLPPGDAVGRSLSDLYPGHDVRPYLGRIREVADTGRAAEATEPGVRADGTPGEFLVYRFPLPDHGRRLVGGMAIDVTAKKEAAEAQARLEDQLRQAQKMEAVGRLAGGIAHDFNNLLTVINGYTDLLLAEAAADPARESLTEVRKAGERAAALTRQLLAFSRRQVLEPKVLNPNAVVADTERMLRRLIGEHVVLATAPDPHVGTVKADPGQLEQILVNLAVNARDAMPAGGTLTIETGNATLDPAYCRTRPDAAPGEYVRIAVRDTGTGIPADALPRIWEPFFTTKGTDRGTGLGLATVHGIVQQSGGHVAVSSEVGHGTTFSVYLPRVTESPAGRSHFDPLPLPRGTETVLLAEDEAALRSLARRVLEGCGYTVLEGEDGRAALAAAAAHPEPIHILVTDVVMPHVGGRELAERLAAVRPDCRVLFLSGYTDDAVVHHGVRAAEFAFLQKPFTPAALAQKVREVLDGTG